MPAPFDPSTPPGRQGFRLPAEWEPHAATWLAWPHKEASWPGRLDRIPPLFVEMVRHLAPGEHVHLNLNDDAMETEVRARLQAAAIPATAYTLHRIPTNDAWARDHGPMFLVRDQGGRREQVILDWGYNAWGGKYPPFDLDDVVPTRVAQELGLPVVSPGIVMEGGSLDGDGRGTLLTSESCLLNPNRNPHLNRQAIETCLGDYLGARKVLWLGEGIEGDDTDGHVDDLTRFIAPNTVVTVVEDNPADANFAPLQDNLRRLQHMTDADGFPLRIYQLPMPTRVEYDGQRVPASYANFYIGNEVVLLPTYGCPADARARSILEVLFPTRRVLGMDCRDLIWGLGAFHCFTQQPPALLP
ncbi:MAG: agmatine deiminase family protein [Terriglobales bacterium]